MKGIYYERNIPKILLTKFNMKVCEPLVTTNLNAVHLNNHLPDPPFPSERFVKVRCKIAGICGTDLSFYESKIATDMSLEPFPRKNNFLGHESVGVVEKIGKEVTKVKVGDRVLLREYMFGCDTKDIVDKCEYCKKGNYSLCENYGVHTHAEDFDLGAGMGDYYLATQEQLMVVNDKEVTDDMALMVEPTAVAVRSVLRMPPKPHDKILVIGGGTIGLGIVQVLKIIEPNCEIHLIEPVKYKQDFALKHGADKIVDCYKGRKIDTKKAYAWIAAELKLPLYKGMFGNETLVSGYDKLYDAVGTSWSFHNGIRWLKAQGEFISVGQHFNYIKFDHTPVWWKELTIQSIDSHGSCEYEGKWQYDFDIAYKWIKDGTYDVKGMITHRFPLEKYHQGFKTLLKNVDNHIKTILVCDEKDYVPDN